MTNFSRIFSQIVPPTPRQGLLHSDQVLLAQVVPGGDAGTPDQGSRVPQQPPVVSDAGPAVVIPAPASSAPATQQPSLALSLAQLSQVRQERTRILSDANIIGANNLPAYQAASTTTYLDIAVTLLRLRYYLEGRQTDVASIRTPLTNWLNMAPSSTDPVFRDSVQGLRSALQQLTQLPNASSDPAVQETVQRAQRMITLIDQVQSGAPATPQAGPTPTPGSSAPASAGSAPASAGSPPATPHPAGSRRPHSAGSRAPRPGGSAPASAGSTPASAGSTPASAGSAPTASRSAPAPASSAPAPAGSNPPAPQPQRQRPM
ncbi:MAG: hypothetical protein U1F57_06440 [bacterium]